MCPVTVRVLGAQVNDILLSGAGNSRCLFRMLMGERFDSVESSDPPFATAESDTPSFCVKVSTRAVLALSLRAIGALPVLLSAIRLSIRSEGRLVNLRTWPMEPDLTWPPGLGIPPTGSLSSQIRMRTP